MTTAFLVIDILALAVASYFLGRTAEANRQTREIIRRMEARERS